VVDYTLFLNARQPTSIGGTHWTLTYFEGQVLVFVAAYIYNTTFENSDENISPQTIWAFFICLSVLTFASFFLLLLTMKGGLSGKYARSFLSTATGSQYVCSMFRNSTVDEEKIQVFVWHPSLI
jgi:hypothetical protein